MIIIYILFGLVLFGITVWTFRILKHFLKSNYKQLSILLAYVVIIGASIHGLQYLIIK